MIDSPTFRRTVGQFATGVTVITIEAEGAVHAMTANSFTSLSLDPPLVLFCVGRDTKMGQLVQGAPGFSVNILHAGQQDISSYFAGAWRQETVPAFRFARGEGTARLEGCAAALECSMYAVYEGGDHWIVVGRVAAVHRTDKGCRPLVFFDGRYVSVDDVLADSAPARPAEGV